MPIPSLNLGRCFDAAVSPDKVAIIDISRYEQPIELSYRDFDAECNAVARGLLRRGLKRGDRVGILSLNRYEMLAAYFGTMRAGMVSVPVSFKLAADTVDYIVRDAGVKAIFHDRERASLCPPDLARIDFDSPDGYAALKDPGAFETVEPEGRELGMMLYTSGSTGRPKGVLLSHESQRWAIASLLKLFGDLSHHRYIVAAPMFHMNATVSVKQALAAGASLVLMPSFDAKTYARALERFRVTWLTSVPTMLALVARERELIGSLDFSSVERVTMGSAPLTQALVDKVQAIFPKALLNNSYGTTEAGPCPFGPHPDGIPRPPVAAGYPIPGSEVALREGPSPDEGVLYMRSPMCMEGYNNLPEKTAEVMRGGWYRSGDVMRREKSGFYYFVGRADDMFVVGGENVWPGEVERLIERLPGVHQSVVVPVPDEIKGALPFAFVVRQPGAAVDEAAVKAFTIESGPAFAHPRFVSFIDAIPLAATNKPDRRRLTEEATRLARGRRPTVGVS
ncbi:MAG TPA: class I adenylate-forming enzyme family protein [Stellaceae bacterium]|nr:class I adenylate-forming enzyme family protein [Stellaceae bacterium]